MIKKTLYINSYGLIAHSIYSHMGKIPVVIYTLYKHGFYETMLKASIVFSFHELMHTL